MKASIVYLHAITPVHSGTGQTVAVIDLPIAREKATGWPIIPGSSIKGVMRDAFSSGGDAEAASALFGTQNAAGKIVFTDQRILCLPVRSFFGTFAWVTSPLVLTRFITDMGAMGVTLPFQGAAPVVSSQDACKVSPGSKLVNNNKVYLEDLDLTVEEDAVKEGDGTTKAIAEGLAAQLFEETTARRQFTERFAIVSDELFSFLSENGTEIAARIALDEETGTTSGSGGNLWYEEAVPAETLFVGAALCTNGSEPAEVLKPITAKPIQVGGNASVGRGLCRVIVK